MALHIGFSLSKLSPKLDHPEGTRLHLVQSRNFLALLLVYLRGRILCCFPLTASGLLPHGDGKRRAAGDTSRVIDGS